MPQRHRVLLQGPQAHHVQPDPLFPAHQLSIAFVPALRRARRATNRASLCRADAPCARRGAVYCEASAMKTTHRAPGAEPCAKNARARHAAQVCVGGHRCALQEGLCGHGVPRRQPPRHAAREAGLVGQPARCMLSAACVLTRLGCARRRSPRGQPAPFGRSRQPVRRSARLSVGS